MSNVVLISPVLLIVLGTTTIILETSLLEMPNLLVHMRAKEFCSCDFTLRNDKEYCLKKNMAITMEASLMMRQKKK